MRLRCSNVVRRWLRVVSALLESRYVVVDLRDEGDARELRSQQWRGE
jgi:hypothetical protein